MKSIILLLFFFSANSSFSQDKTLLFKNDHYQLDLWEYDSVYSMIEYNSSSSESYHFGMLNINGDTLNFSEIDTFLVKDAYLFYSDDKKLSKDSLKILVEIQFPNGSRLTYHYMDFIIDDVVYKYTFDQYKYEHNITIPRINETFNIRVENNIGVCGTFLCDLKDNNTIQIKLNVFGYLAEPGINTIYEKPEKLIYKGKEYYFNDIYIEK